MHRTIFMSVVGVVAAPVLGVLLSSSAEAAASCDGRRATIVGTNRSEVINGTSGADVIAPLGGDDTVNGLGGNDRICGGFGTDRLSGRRGNDRVFGGMDRIGPDGEGGLSRTGDVLRGGAGDDRMVPVRDTRPADDINMDAIVWDDAPRVVTIGLVNGRASGHGQDTFVPSHLVVVGSDFGDEVNGSGGADHINAGRGPAVVHGAGGDDVVFADEGQGAQNGNDRVWGGTGDDEITSDAGRDQLFGGPGEDVIADFDGATDVIAGNDGADLLVGQLSTDGGTMQFLGGLGADQLMVLTALVNATGVASSGTWDLATGRLTYSVEGTAVRAVTGSIQDGDLHARSTTWRVQGTNGSERISAAVTAGTVFRGLAGNDRFLGSDSSDTFQGGAGTDTAEAMGAGTDTCVGVEVFEQADCENVTP